MTTTPESWAALRQTLHAIVDRAAVVRGDPSYQTNCAREELAERGLVLPHLRPGEIEATLIERGASTDTVHPLLLLAGSFVAMAWTRTELNELQAAAIQPDGGDERHLYLRDHCLWLRQLKEILYIYVPDDRSELTKAKAMVNRAVDWMVDTWSKP